MKLILGIDPGSRVTGWGIISLSDGLRQFVDSGVFNLKSEDMGERLMQLNLSLLEILDKYPAQLAVIEKIFLGNNVDSVFKLGHARGVCLMTVKQKGLQTFEYSPRQVKQSVTGSGSATKEQVQQLVLEELRIKKVLKHDASDALALAICHTYQMEIEAKMKRLKGEISI